MSDPTPRCCFSAPAYGPTPAQLPSLAERAAAAAACLGAEAVLAPSCRSSSGDRVWLPLSRRQEDLPLIEAADYWWAVRGGHGCQHLLSDLLQASALPPFLGYSDCTVIHAVYRQRQFGPTFYAGMPLLSFGRRATTSLQAGLAGSLSLDAASQPGVVCLRPGAVAGSSFAACLRVLAALAGTSVQPDLHGCVLFLEDIDERPYAVDRCLLQCQQAGILAGITGLIFGRLPHTRPEESDEPAMQSLLSVWAEQLAVPCLYRLPFGHCEDPLSIPCGQYCLGEFSPDWQLHFSHTGG